uniref:DUF1618 domain-containing protein n=1 Tax=Oryza glumipatula TaxID=40148 RepID=A0A0E0A2D4_9ORYZ
MASGSGEGKGDIPSVVLLELWGHVADDDDDDHRPDATTATSTTSTGLTISVTLRAATPPALSHLSVDCPGLADLDPQPLGQVRGAHGGAKGTVGWVDLWRGILLCDVLEDSPKLRDMPLPLPARVNWPLFLNRCPYYCRDIVVSQSRDTIKYVEMEFTNGWPPSDFEARI